MAPKITRRRWRRPERLTLEHPPVQRRKEIGAPTPLALEPALARKASRRRLESLLVLFLVLCALQGLAVAAASGLWVILPATMGLGVLYFFCARQWGDEWLRRALRVRDGAPARLRRLAASEARSAGVQPPDVLLTSAAEPNALALALRRRMLILTDPCVDLDELALEGILAHEVIHLRDGDAAVGSLYLVLAGAPDLLFRGAGIGLLLAVPLWPVAATMRLARRIAQPPDREHRADVAAAMLTRYPPGLVDALDLAGGGSSGLRPADGLWFVARGVDESDAQTRAALVAEM